MINVGTMNLLRVTLLLLLAPAAGFSQTIDITVRGFVGGSASLGMLSGETVSRLDTVAATGPGRVD
jgi:hypothetical protein